MLKRISDFFKSRFNSYQKALVTLGCMVGLPLSIILILTGIAAIPLTGGASLMPTWLAIALFVMIVTGNFASAGNYTGQALDTIASGGKLTNEKIATIAGCVIGLALSLIAIPLHCVGIRFIAEKAAVPLWELLVYSVPLTMGQFGSCCSYIGRAIDNWTKQHTIFDLFRKKKEEPKAPSAPPVKKVSIESYIVMNHCLKKSSSLPDLKKLANDRELVFQAKKCYPNLLQHSREKQICYNTPVAISIGGEQHIYMSGRKVGNKK